MPTHLLTASACPHASSALTCPVCEVWTATARQRAEVGADRVAEALQRTRQAGATAVALRDGDLTTRPEALELLALTRDLGFSEVELWTEGRLLAVRGAATRLRHAGATAIAAPLYGDTAAAHDHIAAVPGHFATTLKGLRAARAAGMRSTVLAPVLRPTFRALPRLVAGARELGAGAVQFSLTGAADRDIHPLLPHPALAADAVLAAARQARALGLEATVEGMVPCLLDDLAAVLWRPASPAVDARGGETPPQGWETAYGRPCRTCTWRDVCPGVAAAMVARHGWQWVAARADAPPAANPAVE